MSRKRAAVRGHQIHDPSADGLEAAQASAAGTAFEWHYGRVTGLGCTVVVGGRGVPIVGVVGGATSHVGEITDSQWEVFKLAFTTAGRVAILSDGGGEEDGWRHDYRYLEAVR
jgi:hypothetical protein